MNPGKKNIDAMPTKNGAAESTLDSFSCGRSECKYKKAGIRLYGIFCKALDANSTESWI